MVKRRVCLACRGGLHRPTAAERRAAGDLHTGVWVHDSTGTARCPTTWADPGPEFIADHEWVPHARAVIEALALLARLFTADDVWAELERLGIPPPLDKRLLGQLMLGYARDGVLINTDQRVLTARPEAHRQPITQWVGTDEAGVVIARRRA